MYPFSVGISIPDRTLDYERGHVRRDNYITAQVFPHSSNKYILEKLYIWQI